VPLCTGHSGTVMDLHFNPFVDECVASASDDTTAKVWMVPEGGPTEDIEKERVSLVGHHKKVIQVEPDCGQCAGHRVVRQHDQDLGRRAQRRGEALL